MMIIRQPVGLGSGRLCVIVLALCVCVLMQMLGTPVTLLNHADISDDFAGSALEGFSVPPTLPQLAVSSESTLTGDFRPSVHVSEFAVPPFHPPVR
jgi:hypothetical protein